MDLTVVVDGLDHPEGVATGPHGELYAGGELGQVYRIDRGAGSFEQVADCGGFLLGLAVDGAAGAKQVVAALPGTVPDGVCVDTTGRAYVFCYRPDRILTVDPDGTVDVLADDPIGTTLSAPTNGVWVGADLDELVVANLG